MGNPGNGSGRTPISRTELPYAPNAYPPDDSPANPLPPTEWEPPVEPSNPPSAGGLPRTGDDSRFGLWLGLMAFSLLGAILALFARRKKRGGDMNQK